MQDKTGSFWSPFFACTPRGKKKKMGHPLGRSQASTPSSSDYTFPPAVFDGGFSLHYHPASCLAVQIEPVSSMLGVTESCLPPIWINRCAMNCLALWPPCPEKPWWCRSVRANSQIRGSRHPPGGCRLACCSLKRAPGAPVFLFGQLSTTSKSWVISAVLPSMIEAEQYFSADRCTACSTRLGSSALPVTVKWT